MSRWSARKNFRAQKSDYFRTLAKEGVPSQRRVILTRSPACFGANFISPAGHDHLHGMLAPKSESPPLSQDLKRLHAHQLEISDSSRASTLERICLNQFFNLLLLLAGDLPLKRSLNLQSKDLPLSRRDFHHPCMTSRHAGRRAHSLAPEKELYYPAPSHQKKKSIKGARTSSCNGATTPRRWRESPAPNSSAPRPPTRSSPGRTAPPS